MSTRRLLFGAIIVVAAAYALSYRFFPSHASRIGLDLEHHRSVARAAELWIYSPAAYIESALLRVWPTLYRAERGCPQVVVLDYVGVPPNHADARQVRFHSGPVPAPIEKVIRADEDILEYTLRARPGHGRLVSSDGVTLRTCEYFSCRLDDAVAGLTERHTRPWTIARVLAWYREAQDAETRLHLVRILGASDDPRAALALGRTLEREPATIDEIDERALAARVILDHFIPQPPCGDWPQSGVQGRGTGHELGWFRANKARLEKVCEGL